MAELSDILARIQGRDPEAEAAQKKKATAGMNQYAQQNLGTDVMQDEPGIQEIGKETAADRMAPLAGSVMPMGGNALQGAAKAGAELAGEAETMGSGGFISRMANKGVPPASQAVGTEAAESAAMKGPGLTYPKTGGAAHTKIAELQDAMADAHSAGDTESEKALLKQIQQLRNPAASMVK